MVIVGIYPNELKTYVHTNIYTQLLTIAFFLIPKTWKQPRGPSIGECINKLWYIPTMEYYVAMKRNDLSSHEKTWRNLKRVLLSERR